MLEAFGKFVKGRLLFRTAGEQLFGPLAVGDVVLDPDCVEEPASGVANSRGGDGDPNLASIRTPKSLFDGVALDFARDLPSKLGLVVLDIFGQSRVKNRAAEDLLGRVSHHRGKMCVHPQELSFDVDLGDTDAGLLVGRGELSVLLPKQFLGAQLLRHILRLTSRVNDFPIAHAGGARNPNLTDRPILGTKASRTFDEPLAPA